MARYDPDAQVCLVNPDSIEVATRAPTRAPTAPAAGSGVSTAPAAGSGVSTAPAAGSGVPTVPAAGSGVSTAPAAESGVPNIEVVEVGDGYGIAAARVGRGEHTCAAVFDPPLADLRALPIPTRRQGSILLQADGTTELRARYGLTRVDDRVEIAIEGFGPWRTRLRRPLLAVLFRLPVFRRWPTTYRWRATVDLTTSPDARLTSRWERRSVR